MDVEDPRLAWPWAPSLSSAPATTPARRGRNVVEAVKAVADFLGNRPAVCRQFYVHPEVLEAYIEGALNGKPAAAGAAAPRTAPASRLSSAAPSTSSGRGSGRRRRR